MTAKKPAAAKRHRIYKAVVSLCVCVWLVPAALGQGTHTLDQVFANMDETQKTFRSVEASIERTHVTVVVNDKDVSSGKFFYTRRGKDPRVKLEIMKPMTQYLLIDKGKLQMYMPSLKQVQEASLSGRQDKVEMFMALGFGQSSQDLKKNFDVSLAGEEIIDGKKTTVLELKPKNTTMFRSIRMWLDQQKWVSVQLKTTESGGDYMTVKFSDLKMNPKIPDSVFDLKMPKDVNVIKM